MVRSKVGELGRGVGMTRAIASSYQLCRAFQHQRITLQQAPLWIAALSERRKQAKMSMKIAFVDRGTLTSNGLVTMSSGYLILSQGRETHSCPIAESNVITAIAQATLKTTPTSSDCSIQVTSGVPSVTLPGFAYHLE